MKKRHQQKFAVLAIFLALAFNIPLLLIFDVPKSIAGFPLIYVYIFMVWVLAIIVSYIILKKHFE